MAIEDVQYFSSEGIKIAFHEAGAGEAILLIHGFASSARVNWIATGWAETLIGAGYRVIAIDNRGHGNSEKIHAASLYYPELMAGDAKRLLDYLGIGSAHVMGYSMGARIAGYLALEYPTTATSVIFGGLGIALVTGAGQWEPVREALLADDSNKIVDARGLMFRKFADHTKSDRIALAACVMTSKKELSADRVREISQPALVAVGEKDDIAGRPEPLVELLPHGELLNIPGRDHMLSVGDKIYKRGVVEFLARHKIR